MGQNPYPIEIQAGDDKGPVVFGGDATFTDPDNQPGGGGLPTGWTEDASNPANVSTEGGTLGFDADGNSGVFESGAAFQPGGTGPAVSIQITDGVVSNPSESTAFTAAGDNGATVALDAGGLDVLNVGELTAGPGTGGSPQVQVSVAGFAAQNADGSSAFLAATGDTAADVLVAFFGADLASQPVAPVTLGDVIAALQTLGLVGT